LHVFDAATSGLAKGGVQIEPDVAIVREYAMHGLLAMDGSLRLGSLVEQRCDASGAWLASHPLALASAGEREVFATLRAEAARVAAALARAGYFGPFGIDAHAYLAPDSGAPCLQPRSEINARYSMGFPAGFAVAGKKPDAFAALRDDGHLFIRRQLILLFDRDNLV